MDRKYKLLKQYLLNMQMEIGNALENMELLYEDIEHYNDYKDKDYSSSVFTDLLIIGKNLTRVEEYKENANELVNDMMDEM